jgi:hypothetical protein
LTRRSFATAAKQDEDQPDGAGARSRVSLDKLLISRVPTGNTGRGGESTTNIRVDDRRRTMNRNVDAGRQQPRTLFITSCKTFQACSPRTTRLRNASLPHAQECRCDARRERLLSDRHVCRSE